MLSLWCFIALLVPLTSAAKNSKRGLGFAAEVPGDVFNANQSHSVISWQYNWASMPQDFLATSNIKFIPMQWGSAEIEQFQNDVKTLGADTILTFNEPDFSNESNMNATDAARLWMQYIQPLKASGVRLGGPAVTASSTGGPWLTEFFAACTNCTVDFLPLHWYGSGTEGFYNYLWGIHGQFPKIPIWITEYAETSTNDTVVHDFMNATINYFDSLDWIERYAWFGFFRPQKDIHYNLLTDDGGLNALGELYVGAKTVHTQIVTPSPTPTYHTVNGADNTNAGPPTSWPATNGARGGWKALNIDQISRLGVILLGCTFGMVWTLW